MDVAEEPRAERRGTGARDLVQTKVERGNVVRGFLCVLAQRLGRRVVLEEQQVRERGLGALDLRGEHGLLAHVHVEQAVGLEGGGDALEPAEGPSRGLAQALQLRRESRNPLTYQPRSFLCLLFIGITRLNCAHWNTVRGENHRDRSADFSRSLLPNRLQPLSKCLDKQRMIMP